MARTEAGFAPWNDYDLLLVTPTRSGWERIGPLCAELKKDLGLPGLDIVPFTPGDLVRAADTMLVIDARRGHGLLRGTAGPLHDIPAVPVARTEALILLLNRMVCLLECPPQELTGEMPDPTRFPSQVSKAVLAVVDAALVKAGTYVVPYREKVARFKALAPDDPLAEAAEEALSFRVEPGPRRWSTDLWRLACGRLIAEVGSFVGSPSASASHVAQALWRRRFLPVRPTLRSLLKTGRFDARRRAVECAEVLVLGASGLEGSDQADALRLAHRFLAHSGPAPRFTCWSEAARLSVQRWFEVCYGEPV